MRDIQQHRGLRSLLFSNSSVGYLRLFLIDKKRWRRQDQRLNVTAVWRKHLNWGQIFNHSQHKFTSSLNTLVVDPAGLWTHDFPLGIDRRSPNKGVARELQRRRRLRKRQWKRVVAQLQILSRLFHLVQFVKYWQFLICWFLGTAFKFRKGKKISSSLVLYETWN